MENSNNRLLENNKVWANSVKNNEPEFFNELAKGQTPEYLWIGCSDSRVPADQITGAKPGDLFVHRNIANMVVHSDMNLLSVLSYAVDVLQVKQIIVCGHYGCGGVLAAMGNKQYGLIDNWLRHIKDVYRHHQLQLDAIKDDDQRFRKFVELNVMEQVQDVSKTSIVQNAWQKKQPLQIHGWVFDLANGLLKDLDVSSTNPNDLHAVYQFEKVSK